MRIALLGLGLIGGSIARALRASDAAEFRGARLVAWSPTGAGPALGLADGMVDDVAAAPAAAVAGADLVILAAPPLGILGSIEDLGGASRAALGPSAVVTDVGSTKGVIVGRARQAGLRFVGGHPMAGRELAGYGASDPDLFRDRPWVVVEDGARTEDVALVEGLAAACGARPMRMTAAAHDAATAAVSHLPLVAAAALVEAVVGSGDGPGRAGWEAAAKLAASGWRDMTRLARGDAAMGAGIATTNAAALAPQVRALRDALDRWLDELERDGGPDPDRLAARFQAARARLEAQG